MTTPAAQHAIQKVERLYSTVTFLHWFATSMTAAVSILLARERGLSLAEIGLYTSVFAACTALLELPTGGLADAVGRKRVTLWAYWFSMLSRLLLLLSVNVPLYLLYAVVAATARALGSGALEGWFINTLKTLDPGVNLQPILARNSALTMLALGGGALCGGALPGLVHGWPFSPLLLPIVAALLAHAITFGVTWKYVQDAEPPHANLYAALSAGFTGLRGAFKSAWTLVRADQPLQRLLLVEVSLGIIIAATETYWQPFFASTFHLNSGNTIIFGVLLAGCYGAGVLGNLLARRTLNVLAGNDIRLGVLTQVLQGAGLILLTCTGSLWLAAGLLWFTFAVRSLFSSSFAALYNALVPDQQRSLMLSVMSVAFFLGVTGGNAGLGAVATHAGIAPVWAGVGIAIALSAAFLRPLQREQPLPRGA